MRRISTMLVAWLVIGLTAATGAVLAQSAGDEQYTDPLDGVTRTDAPAPKRSPATPRSGAPGTAPRTPVRPSSGTGTDGSAGGAANRAAAPSQPAVATLPRTGRELWPPLAAGLALLAAGALLLVVTRPSRRRGR